jgi:hypothetical protein
MDERNVHLKWTAESMITSLFLTKERDPEWSVPKTGTVVPKLGTGMEWRLRKLLIAKFRAYQAVEADPFLSGFQS